MRAAHIGAHVSKLLLSRKRPRGAGVVPTQADIHTRHTDAGTSTTSDSDRPAV